MTLSSISGVCSLVSVGNFDTYGDPDGASQAMVNAINAIPSSVITLLGFSDSANGITAEGWAALQSLGSSLSSIGFRQGYTLIGSKSNGAYCQNGPVDPYTTVTCTTSTPTASPTPLPISNPTFPPTPLPTRLPSPRPSVWPSSNPSIRPTCQPSSKPSEPSSQPSCQPIVIPSHQPTGQPTRHPTSKPTNQPYSTPSHVAAICTTNFGAISSTKWVACCQTYKSTNENSYKEAFKSANEQTYNAAFSVTIYATHR